MVSKANNRAAARGRLRIGDDWNAITIIALSQSNPLKAVAEFVENSIDARARNIVIVRGQGARRALSLPSRRRRRHSRDDHGVPDFRYVATHIGDSIKRRLKAQGAPASRESSASGCCVLDGGRGVGDDLAQAPTAGLPDAHAQRRPELQRHARQALVARVGTELKIKPLLPGIRQISGEKLQWYLASELRDRIRQSGVKIKVIDRHARKEFKVEPRRFDGRLLHDLPAAGTSLGEIYVELYLDEASPDNHVGLYRAGTRVLDNLAELDAFQRPPWTLRHLQGIVDAPFSTSRRAPARA